MKRIIPLLLLVVPALALADTYNYITLTSSTVEQSIALKTVKKITFEGTSIVVTTTDGATSTMPLAEFQRFTFTPTGDGIRQPKRPVGDLCIEAGRIVANGQGLLLLYNTNGQVVRQQFVSGSRSEIQMTDLPHGIYIAKLGNKTLKVIR